MQARFLKFAARMEAQAAHATTPDKAMEFALRARLFRLLANDRSMKGDAFHRFFGRFARPKRSR
jgi:hypothetical protein